MQSKNYSLSASNHNFCYEIF